MTYLERKQHCLEKKQQRLSMINGVIPLKACGCSMCLKEKIEDRWYVIAETQFQVNVSYNAFEKHSTLLIYCKRNNPNWENCFDPRFDKYNLITLEKFIEELPPEIQENIFFNLDIFG